MLATLDIVDTLIEHGVIARSVQYRDRKMGLIAEFDLKLLADDTAHPFRIQLDQYTMAQLLYERLRSHDAVEFRFRNNAFAAHPEIDGCVVSIRTPNGAVHLAAPLVVGADGASSAIRETAGIGFDGLTYPNRYITVFTQMAFEETVPGIGPVNYVTDAEQWCILLRSPQHWRVLYPADPNLSDEALLADDAIFHSLADLTEGRRPTITHRRAYHVHQRIASTYRLGPVLLAGDAAHINNPAGGMGLNGGIHDAFSLAPAIASVWHGLEELDTLDRYAVDRRRTALEYIRPRSHATMTTLAETDPDRIRTNHEALRSTAAEVGQARQFLRDISMISTPGDRNELK